MQILPMAHCVTIDTIKPVITVIDASNNVLQGATYQDAVIRVGLYASMFNSYDTASQLYLERKTSHIQVQLMLQETYQTL